VAGGFVYMVNSWLMRDSLHWGLGRIAPRCLGSPPSPGCRRDRRSLRIQLGLSRIGGGRRGGPDGLRSRDARNSRQGDGIAAVLSPLLAIPEVPSAMGDGWSQLHKRTLVSSPKGYCRSSLARREADEDG
jgi:hypothetical protein